MGDACSEMACLLPGWGLGRFEIGVFLQSGLICMAFVLIWLAFQCLKMGRLWLRMLSISRRPSRIPWRVFLWLFRLRIRYRLLGTNSMRGEAIARLIWCSKNGILNAWTGRKQPYIECRTIATTTSFPARRQNALASPGRWLGRSHPWARSTMLNEDYRDMLHGLSDEKVRFLLSASHWKERARQNH